jgi:quercetin dioxygenase-like cupin family protein
MYSEMISPTDGREVRFAGFGTRYIVVTDAFAMVEHDLAPHMLGAPMHTHANEDEVSHVLAGRLGVQVGDTVYEAGPGHTVVKPRGIAHAFWNPGDEPLRFLELITPAGFEEYFAELEPILGGGGPPDIPALMAVQARYALSMDMASMPRLIAEHGLVDPAG